MLAGDLCEYHDGRRAAGLPVVLVGDDGRPLPAGVDPAAPGGEGVDMAPPGGEGVEPAPASRPVADLPPAPAVDAEPIAAAAPVDAGDDGAAELERLERLAARYLGAVPEDPAEAEAEAEAVDDEEPGAGTGAAAAAGVLAGAWTPERVTRILAWLNPYVERSGKTPLSAAELREGGEVLAPVLSDLLGDWAPGPYTAAIAWVALTFGTRYAGEVAGLVRRLLFGRRAAPATIEAPRSDGARRSAAEPEPEPADVAGLGRGWAAAAGVV